MVLRCSVTNVIPLALLQAAKKLAIDHDEINEVKFWDGETLSELHLTADGKWVEGVENSLELQPTEVNLRIWQDAKPALGRLMDNSEDGEALTKIKGANTAIVEENKARQFPEAMLNSFTIDIDTFRAIFKAAAPFLIRLRKSHADVEARTKFDALNEQLKDFNRAHQYPSEWTMVLPQENAPGPIAEEKGHPHDEIPSNGTQPVGKPCYRRCTRRGGYVREDGICSGVGVQVYCVYLGRVRKSDSPTSQPAERMMLTSYL